MSKYLDTQSISSELMNLIKEAREKIILVTYSLQVNPQIQERLKTKSVNGRVSIEIYYGNTTLKPTECEWLKEIDGLRIFQKKNLHAKCYLNENKAIISSMNLYDYSQNNNIEMGVLIDRNDNENDWQNLMEDISNLRVNGTIVNISDLLNGQTIEKNDIEEVKEKLNYQQQLEKFVLESYRTAKSSELRQSETEILSNELIYKIVKANTPDEIKAILKQENKTKLSNEILEALTRSKNYSIGRVLDVRYGKDGVSYDRIQMVSLDNQEKRWYDTKKELPKKDVVVAVQINGDWFNKYIVLEQTDLPFSNPNYIVSTSVSKQDGHCIRCGKSITYNPERPLCKDCYAIWNQFGDETYPEKYCHCCGKEAKTSFEKPLCYNCWKKTAE
ncbi:MAG: hypothetical protein J6W37_09525 [Bacteroidales bacterium]|nr:hypothetical protein [Bacteroidales bacterium]